MSHIFDCPDGTLIEVESDNARRWRSDTCQCILVFEQDTLELDFAIQVCQLHKTVAAADLVSTVMSHCSTINHRLGISTDLTRTQKDELAQDRQTEQSRIAALGRPQIRADETTKDAIEADLRSKGR